MKSIGVLWDDEVSWDGESPFGDVIDETYEYFSQLAEEEEIQLLIGKYTWYSDGELEKCWVLRDGNWIKGEEVSVEGVFDKFHFDEETKKLKKEIDSSIGIVNDPELEELCKDKLLTFERFPEFVPETREASEDSIKDILEEYGKAVLKPRFAYGGKGIHIVEDNEEVPDIEFSNYIVQRFVDASGGIEGIADGSHDLRAILVDGDVKGCYVRYNEESEISNVSQGGVKEPVKIENFPEEAKKIIEKINTELEYSPSIFSVDFFFDPDGNPWIVELNSKPGLNFFGDKEMRKQIRPVVEGLIESFKQV